MLASAELVAFVPVADLGRARSFYENILGLPCVDANRYDGVEQDDLGIWTTPAGDQVVWFKDFDGNTLSFTQPVDR